MIVFVTGGTGALGTPTVARLLAQGHTVRALAHSSQSADRLRDAGADVVVGSLFDQSSLVAAVRGADAIVHLATRIPGPNSAWRRRAWRENDRIRAEGTRALVEAALAAGVPAMVYPSFAPSYADGGAAWLSVGSPVAANDVQQSTLLAERELHRFRAGNGAAAVLRLGALYGPHSASSGAALRPARRGLCPFLGPPAAYTPLIWDEDAAAALVAAVETRLDGDFDVVDDEPLTRQDLATVLSGVLGRTVRLAPSRLLAPVLGKRMSFLLRSQRVSNAAFKSATSWAPQVATARDGLPRLAHLGRAPEVGAGVRGLLALVALGGLIIGSWQAFWPASFFTDFPGFGRQWAVLDGPYNEHFIRDTGQANLAIALVAAIACLKPTVRLARVASAAIAVAAIPHAIYHFSHLGHVPAASDRLAQGIVLAANVLVALTLVVLTFRRSPD